MYFFGIRHFFYLESLYHTLLDILSIIYIISVLRFIYCYRYYKMYTFIITDVVVITYK